MDLRTLIPAWEIRKEKIAMLKKGVQEALHNIYTKEMRYPDPIIRDLTAEDLGLENWITPTQSKGMRSVWIDTQISAWRFIAIYKITQITQNPKVHTMNIIIGGCVRGIYDLDTMYGVLPVLHKLDEYKDDEGLNLTFAGLEEIRMEAYLPTAYVIPPETILQIETVSSFDNEGDWLVLGGYVLEPSGMKIM